MAPHARRLAALALAASSIALLVPPATAAAGPSSGWGEAQLLETDDRGPAQDVDLAMSANGDGLAVWEQFDGATWGVWGNHYRAGSGWGAPELLSSAATNSNDAHVAMDGKGNGLAVWLQDYSGRPMVYAKRYFVNAGWDVPYTFNPLSWNDTESQTEPSVAVNSEGQAAIVFRQCCDTGNTIWALWYDQLSGGATSSVLYGPAPEQADMPRVAVSDGGDGFAIWRQYTWPNNTVVGSHYAPGSGWIGPDFVETDALVPYVFDLAVAADAFGNAAAMWGRMVDPQWNLAANRFTAGRGWGLADVVEHDDNGSAARPRVAFDAAGNAIAVWHQLTVLKNEIFAATMDNRGEWGQPITLESANADPSVDPAIAVTPQGAAVVVWDQVVPRPGGATQWYDLAGASFDPVSGWSAPVDLEQMGGVVGTQYIAGGGPCVAVDPRGNALAVWVQDSGGRFDVWSNRFVWPDTTPPVVLIDTPAGGTFWNVSQVEVAGLTEPAARVSVNGWEASVDASGHYSVNITLTPGRNTITITAWDPSGNVGGGSLDVFFDDPVVLLQQDLADARANVTALSAELNATQDALDVAAAQAAGTNASVAIWAGQLTSMQEQAAVDRATILQLQASQSTLQHDLDSANGNSTAQAAKIDALEGRPAPSGGEPLAIAALLLGAAGVGVAGVGMMRGRGKGLGGAPEGPPNEGP